MTQSKFLIVAIHFLPAYLFSQRENCTKFCLLPDNESTHLEKSLRNRLAVSISIRRDTVRFFLISCSKTSYEKWIAETK
jgi:hypothetical protein